jgi:hypothetical protein
MSSKRTTYETWSSPPKSNQLWWITRIWFYHGSSWGTKSRFRLLSWMPKSPPCELIEDPFLKPKGKGSVNTQYHFYYPFLHLLLMLCKLTTMEQSEITSCKVCLMDLCKLTRHCQNSNFLCWLPPTNTILLHRWSMERWICYCLLATVTIYISLRPCWESIQALGSYTSNTWLPWN